MRVTIQKLIVIFIHAWERIILQTLLSTFPYNRQQLNQMSMTYKTRRCHLVAMTPGEFFGLVCK